MNRMITAWLVFVCFFIFTGCEEDTGEFFIERRDKEIYSEKINEVLRKEHWNYDDKSILYESGKVPDEKAKGFDDIKRVSLKDGFDIEDYKGKEAILASLRIFYFNNDEAGRANFYFIDDEIVCGYYSLSNKIYSISEIDVFSNDVFSGKAEDISKSCSFSEIEAAEKFDGFEEGFWRNGSSVVGTISDEKVKFFKFKDNEFYLDREMDFSKEGLFPMDMSFDNDGSVAVLLGKKKDMGKESIYSEADIQEMKKNGLTDAEINGTVILLADRIVFFDENYNTKFSPCVLEVSSYGSIAYTNGDVYVSRGKGVDIFSNQKGQFLKTKQYMLKQWVERIKAADIDGDGVNEFVMTDGTNLFIYRLEETAALLWRTHLSLESMSERFYIEDLNGDGIKEIYVSDIYLNTSAKYTLTDYGFKAFSVDYGKEYIPGDFNGDGKMDYIAVGNDDESYKVFIQN